MLNQDIFKGRFVIIDKLAPNLDKFNNLFTSNNTESTYLNYLIIVSSLLKNTT